MPGIDTDEFMPEFWPADKILGLILDEQLQGIDAGKIVGQIVNAQVASLAAAKIEGKLTQEQIETIAAEQITGKLTDEQIAEIAAAKIVGKLTDAQLGGISAAKIIGEIASGQIASLEALKITGQLTSTQIKSLEAAQITGQLTSAQIKSIEAALVTGQLTTAQIAGLAAAKIEGQLTSEQIANLAVAKLIGQISESQIAAKAVTAGKINVAELSAISANCGVITAGILEGVSIVSAEKHLIIDREGMRMLATKSPTNNERITWYDKLEFEKLPGNLVARLEATVLEKVSQFTMMVFPLVGEISASSGIRISSENEKAFVRVRIRGTEFTLMESEGKSAFLQLMEEAKRKVNFGTVTVEWAGGSIESKTVEVEHGLGAAPPAGAVTLTPLYVLATRRMTPQLVSTSKTKLAILSVCNDAVPGAGVKQTINWMAIG